MHYFTFMLKKNKKAKLCMLKDFGRRPTCSFTPKLEEDHKHRNADKCLTSHHSLPHIYRRDGNIIVSK